ncbi:MAG: hypothetical protein QOH83_1790, partial [Solirubrobacteraceae bacterium]|nr:hypothetical protein [Solirubrobacteraceae bacterium]
MAAARLAVAVAVAVPVAEQPEALSEQLAQQGIGAPGDPPVVGERERRARQQPRIGTCAGQLPDGADGMHRLVVAPGVAQGGGEREQRLGALAGPPRPVSESPVATDALLRGAHAGGRRRRGRRLARACELVAVRDGPSPGVDGHRRRLDAELVEEQLAAAVEGTRRCRAVFEGAMCGDRQAVPALAQPIGPEQRLGGRERGHAVAGLDLCPPGELERAEVQRMQRMTALVEPGALGAGQQPPAGDRGGLGGERRRPRGRARDQRGGGALHRRLRLLDVDHSARR